MLNMSALYSIEHVKNPNSLLQASKEVTQVVRKRYHSNQHNTDGKNKDEIFTNIIICVSDDPYKCITSAIGSFIAKV